MFLLKCWIKSYLFKIDNRTPILMCKMENLVQLTLRELEMSASMQS